MAKQEKPPFAISFFASKDSIKRYGLCNTLWVLDIWYSIEGFPLNIPLIKLAVLMNLVFLIAMFIVANH